MKANEVPSACVICRKDVATRIVVDRGFVRQAACRCCAKKVEQANRYCKYA